MEKECECYEEEVQPYRKTDYKPIIYKSTQDNTDTQSTHIYNMEEIKRNDTRDIQSHNKSHAQGHGFVDGSSGDGKSAG